jgi:predicted nucleic acid-binding protein
MTVYVESNFVLEIALGQEQSNAAESILRRAERHEIALALPSVCVSEPFSTVTQRSRDLERLGRQLNDKIRERARSNPHEEDVCALESTPALLASINRRELERLTVTVGRVLDVTRVIQIDVAVFAEAMSVMGRVSLLPLDALIYAAILGDIGNGDPSGPHYFINRNTRDFAVPTIAAELDQLNCTFIGSFVEADMTLETPLPG